jgi:hypothetical protein
MEIKNITVGGGPAPVRAYIAELLPEVLEGRIEPGRRDQRARRPWRYAPVVSSIGALLRSILAHGTSHDIFIENVRF